MADANVPADAPAITIAAPPFDDPDADIVLRSVDGVDFHVYMSILSFASSFFKTMFTLPQSLAAPATPPPVSLTEDFHTIDLMLRLCYPFEDPDIATLDDVKRMLEIAEKYDMPKMRERVRKSLVCTPFLEREPLRVYAIAYRWRLEDEVRVAARGVLNQGARNLGPYVQELEDIPASAHYRLLHYYESCATAACSVAERPQLLRSGKSAPLLSDLFSQYMKNIVQRLAKRPDSRTIIDPAISDPSLVAQLFNQEHYLTWRNFATTTLSNEVEKVVSQIELEVKF